jgi:NAD(P)-dependent dehydrogenase (short-subunit alcohol dehydrogenase family)
MRLEGKVAVVVGAGAMAPGWSNGKACAVTYARHGATVVCADRSLDGAKEAVDAMNGYGGQKVRIEPTRDLVLVRLGHTFADCPTFRVDPIAELFPARAAPTKQAK